MNDIAHTLAQRMSLPVIGAPMFIISTPPLVIAQCRAGIIGAMPALNARPASQLDEWLHEIAATLTADQAADPARRIAPFAVNLIVHRSNDRLEQDLACCVRHRVPIVVTSLQPPSEVTQAVHAYGGIVIHDVTTRRHAERALKDGADGLILVCAGAGGHAGTLSPFALLAEVRQFWSGLVALSGAITHGEHILAAQAMGADFAYIGTRFIASAEANAEEAYKRMVVKSHADDIVYTSFFTGVHGNYLKPSIAANGLDPGTLVESSPSQMNMGSSRPKTWRDVWGAGQGVGGILRVAPVADIVTEWRTEYDHALNRIIAAHSNSIQNRRNP